MEELDGIPLLSRVARGDPVAFGRAVDELSVRLLALVRREAGSSLRADYDEEDLFQDVVATAWGRLGDFEDRGPGSFFRWLVGISRNLVRDRRRHLAANGRDGRRHIESAFDGASGRVEPPEVVQTTMRSRVARREEVGRLSRALESLPIALRRPLELHMLQGASIRAIADELAISTGTAWNRLQEGMTELRRAMMTGPSQT